MSNANPPFHNAPASLRSQIKPLLIMISSDSYPLYVNVWNRETMDVHRQTKVGVEPVSDKTLELEAQTSTAENPGHPATEIK